MESAKMLEELKQFSGGVIDTSSLIYLGKSGALAQAAACFLFIVPAAVEVEYGALLPSSMQLVDSHSMIADQAVCKCALQKDIAVISEDKKLLQQAKRQGGSYFNTLMVLLALYAQYYISQAECQQYLNSLRRVARYGKRIWKVGDLVLDEIEREAGRF